MAAYAFGPFVLDVGERLLVREGRRVPLAGKTLQLLQLLVEARGRLVERDAIYDRLWPNVTVEEQNLTVHIGTLRRVLGRTDSSLGYIETVVRAGYRLTVPVRAVASPEPPSAEPPAQTRPLAVLPFSTQGLTEADRYLGMGIADAVITQLGGLPGMGVRPTSVVKDIDGDRDAVEIGRALQVGHVLQGTVRRNAQRLSVSTQLVDVASGTVRWRENFEQPTESGFALQDAIAARVASTLTTLSAEDRADLHGHRPRSSEAYFLQLQARTSLRLHARIPAMKALGLFEQAVELDPDYAVAHAGLASTYLLLTSTAMLRPLPLEEALRLARQSAERAIALDPRLGEAWAVLGRLKMDYEWDWQGAEADLLHAVTISPNSVEAVSAYGQYLGTMGRHDEALETMEHAHRLDPRHVDTLGALAAACWRADQPDRALAVLDDAHKIAPWVHPSAALRVYLLDHLGRHDESLASRLGHLQDNGPRSNTPASSPSSIAARAGGRQ